MWRKSLLMHATDRHMKCCPIHLSILGSNATLNNDNPAQYSATGAHHKIQTSSNLKDSLKTDTPLMEK